MMYQDPNNMTYQADTDGLNRYMTRTFGWMAAGVFTTFLVAIVSAMTGLSFTLYSSGLIFVLTIAELILVVVLSARLQHLSVGTATGMFLAYSVLNGLVFGTYFLIYNVGTMMMAFLVASLYFGIMALYGTFTQKDLSGWGPMLFGGLIAMLIVSVVGIFIGFGAMDFLFCAFGLALFMGYTAFDSQKIKGYYYTFGGESELARKASIMGALNLYLDFINIFLYVLRLLGRNSKR